jgi:NADPH2:quinone reductase
MLRIACQEFGSPELLMPEEASDPQPGSGQTVISVRAAGVSFVDGLMIRGLYQMKPPLPFTPGIVAAGDVIGVGNNVSHLLLGSRVVGCSFDLGGYASRRVLPANAVVPVPEAVTYEVAATAVESYAASLFALTKRVALHPNEWVLVLGAGGGIGLAAVDVAASLGAHVIAAASSPAKRTAALDAGAEVAIDYETEDLKSRVRDITGSGTDVVVDPVGDPFAEPALRSLRGFGRYLVLGFAGGAIPKLPINRVLLENRAIIGVDWGAWSIQNPDANGSLITELLDGAATGSLRPRAPTAFPLDRAAQALNELAQRRITGKLALLP